LPPTAVLLLYTGNRSTEPAMMRLASTALLLTVASLISALLVAVLLGFCWRHHR